MNILEHDIAELRKVKNKQNQFICLTVKELSLL
jgi:hypothetical protein